jgi:phage shock protein A
VRLPTATPRYAAAAAACYNTHGEGAFASKRVASVVEVMTMTLEQLERKVNDLERQVAELRNELEPFRAPHRTADTFGMLS